MIHSLQELKSLYSEENFEYYLHKDFQFEDCMSPCLTFEPVEHARLGMNVELNSAEVGGLSK